MIRDELDTKRMKLKQIIELDNGIFKHMNDVAAPLIWEGRYDFDDMDLEFMMKFGERMPAPLVRYFQDTAGIVSEEGMRRIAKMTYNKYKESWARKYSVLDAQYEVLDNYNMIETEEIDRETLETRIQELLRTNKEANTQINDLLEALENNSKNIHTREGTDVTKSTNKEDNIATIREKFDGKDRTEGTDTLSFVGRLDTETRDLTKKAEHNMTNTNDLTDATTFGSTDTKTNTGTKKTETDGKDTLSFLGRQDVTEGEVLGEVFNYVDGKTTEDEDTTNTTDNEEGVYGFNTAINSVPTKTGDGKVTIDGLKTVIVDNDTETQTKDTTDMATRKEGQEITVQEGDMTVTDNLTETNAKTGTDSTTNKGTVTTTGDVTDTDEGTVTNAKTGQELNGIDRTVIADNLKEGSVKDDITGKSDSTVTYDTTDTDIVDGDSSRKNTGTVTNEGEETENLDDTTTTTGGSQEDRTLTRRGNIGVTTSTQLIKEHIEFWEYSFLDDVYKDVIDMIGLSIYD